MKIDNFSCEMAVIGAGPYGLSTASHLRARGVDVRVFGRPMQFWADHMPKGMLLRSPWDGSNIGDPGRAFTLDRYEASLGSTLQRHLPLEDFVRYGKWFQRQAVSDLDHRNVSQVERGSNGFSITIEDGERLSCKKVVVAAGIGALSKRPAPFDSLPLELVSHTSDPANQDLGRFAGKRIAVIGGGQSAIESAALLYESGAEVEVLIRAPGLRWINSSLITSNRLFQAMMDSRLNPFRAPGKIGPLGVDWVIEHPSLFTKCSRERQDAMTYRAMRPRASGWLKPRVQQVKIQTSRHATSAAARSGEVYLKLNDGSERVFDHVLLGAGYKIDIARYSFLAAELLRCVETGSGYPLLRPGFESSLEGLYFVGAPSGLSFGPFFRFVAGTAYAGNVLARHAARRLRRVAKQPLGVRKEAVADVAHR